MKSSSFRFRVCVNQLFEHMIISYTIAFRGTERSAMISLVKSGVRLLRAS